MQSSISNNISRVPNPEPEQPREQSSGVLNFIRSHLTSFSAGVLGALAFVASVNNIWQGSNNEKEVNKGVAASDFDLSSESFVISKVEEVRGNTQVAKQNEIRSPVLLKNISAATLPEVSVLQENETATLTPLLALDLPSVPELPTINNSISKGKGFSLGELLPDTMTKEDLYKILFTQLTEEHFDRPITEKNLGNPQQTITDEVFAKNMWSMLDPKQNFTLQFETFAQVVFGKNLPVPGRFSYSLGSENTFRFEIGNEALTIAPVFDLNGNGTLWIKPVGQDFTRIAYGAVVADGQLKESLLLTSAGKVDRGFYEGLNWNGTFLISDISTSSPSIECRLSAIKPHARDAVPWASIDFKAKLGAGLKPNELALLLQMCY